MAAEPRSSSEDVKALRQCVNYLASVVALPAVWTGEPPEQILVHLLDSLLKMLALDFIYAKRNNADSVGFEVVRFGSTWETKLEPQQVREELQAWLGNHSKNPLEVSRKLFGEREITLVSVQVGLRGEVGVIVAASQRADFPIRTERLVLDVAANQAAIWLNKSNLPDGLDRRAADRTAELVEANEGLRESETRLQRVIDAIPTIAWCNLPDGSNEFLNKSWRQYTGLSPEESRGWGWQAAFHSEDLPTLMEKWQAMLVSETPGEIEARIRRYDGVYHWFFIRVEPFRDESGKLIRWYGTSTDIDDRKRVEEALRESERESRLIVDTIPGMISVVTPTGDVERVNRPFTDYFDLRAEDINPWRTQDLFHPDDLQRVISIIGQAMASGEPYELVARGRGAKGSYRWIQFRGLPFRDRQGNILRWYTLNTDIDEQKRAAEELRRKEEFLSKAQRLSATGSFSWCIDTDEIVFSEEAYRIFGFEPGEPVTFERLGSRVHPEDIPLLAERTAAARTSGEGHDYEIRLLMPDGSLKYLHTTSNETRDGEGRREYIGAIQDVTPRRQAQEALNKARSELAHVARVTALSALTASIAHEVNQPLSGIVTNAGTCTRMLDANPPNIEGARETARRTIRDANRASEVVSRLKALFTKKAVTFEPFDLNEAAKEVIALSVSDLRRNKIVMQSQFSAGLPPVLGDRIQIQQVILNLVRNALDAMVAVNDRPRELLISTERSESGDVRLSVRDTGVGIAAEIEEKLFEAFHTTKNDGMGIGLSVSRSIMESHRGRLWGIRNEVIGSTFSFSIPVSTNT